MNHTISKSKSGIFSLTCLEWWVWVDRRWTSAMVDQIFSSSKRKFCQINVIFSRTNANIYHFISLKTSSKSAKILKTIFVHHLNNLESFKFHFPQRNLVAQKFSAEFFHYLISSFMSDSEKIYAYPSGMQGMW